MHLHDYEPRNKLIDYVAKITQVVQVNFCNVNESRTKVGVSGRLVAGKASNQSVAVRECHSYHASLTLQLRATP